MVFTAYIFILSITIAVFLFTNRKLKKIICFLKHDVSEDMSDVIDHTSSYKFLLLVNERFLYDEVNLFMDMNNDFLIKERELKILKILEVDSSDNRRLFDELQVQSIPALYEYDGENGKYKKMIYFSEIEQAQDGGEVLRFIDKTISTEG